MKKVIPREKLQLSVPEVLTIMCDLAVDTFLYNGSYK